MSTSPESKTPEFELDLDLAFLPAWAQQPAAANKYEKYTGEEESGRGRRDRPFRSDSRGGGSGGGGGPRRDGARPPARSGSGGGAPGARPFGGGFGGGDRGPRPGGDRGPRREGGFRRQEDAPRRDPLPPLPAIDVNLVPEEKGVESLARQIRLTGRAYPLFEIAQLVLKKNDRYHLVLTPEKPEGGETASQILVCSLDDTVWFSENEAVEHALAKHFNTFYSSEKIPSDPPKGVYTFVAQCGISGVVLGPPNYHDYQNKLRKLHQERFSRMEFDAFKARIKIVKDEEVVKKWVEEQSFKTEFTALNIPETLKLHSMEEAQQHFRATHAPNVIRKVDKHSISGAALATQPCRPLLALARRAVDDQTKFPLRIVNVLSQQFARQGLQFFKVNKTVTHVAVARPHFLDMVATPVSEGVKKIVDFIDATPKCSRRKLIDAFAPATAAAPEATAAPAGEAVTAGDATAAPSPQMAALVSDLHWLVHQGHVIEFASGLLETAKRPLPRPVRPEPKAKAPAPAAAAGAVAEPAAEAEEMAAHETAAAAETAPADAVPPTEEKPEAQG